MVGLLAQALETVRLLTSLPTLIITNAFVLAALQRRGGAVAKLVEWSIIRRIGMLSYGIYVSARSGNF